MYIQLRRLLMGTISLTATGLLLLGHTPALAQGSEAELGILDEIIVTARRRDESLMDTPVSITAFTARDLKERLIVRGNQIAESTPNLIYRSAGGGSDNASNVYIRGIGQIDHVSTAQPGVGLYVDESYIATSVGSLSEILDFESIEVLRGPQGSLFGRNTIGGAILFTTKKPNDQFEGEVEVQLGESNQQLLKGIVNIPFTDNFYGKFGALVRERDGWIDTPNIDGDDGFGSESVQAGRAALRWQADTVTVDLYGDYVHRESDGAPSTFVELNEASGNIGFWNNVVVPFSNNLGANLGPVTDIYIPPAESYINYAGHHTIADSDIYSGGLTIAWDINDALQFKSLTNFRDVESFHGSDSDGTPEPLAYAYFDVDSEQFTQELHLSGIGMDSRLTWLAGLYYFEEQTLSLSPVNQPRFSVFSGSRVENKSSAVFGQLNFDFSDQLSLTVGGRYTDEQFEFVVDDSIQFLTLQFSPACPGPPCTDLPPPSDSVNDRLARRGDGQPGYRQFANPPDPGSFKIVPNGVFESDHSDTEPYLNLAYRWSDSIMTYLSYSEGFKGGGFTERIPPGNVVVAFAPEFAKVYELGAKIQSPSNRFRLTGALFYTDYEDLQVNVSTALGGSTANASDAVIKGFELEAVGTPTNRLTLSAGVGYLDGEYKNVDPSVIGFDENSIMPSVPKWQINASAAYVADLGDGQLRFRLDYSYQDEMHFDARNLIITPSYEVVNGFVSYTPGSGKWELAIQARNLLDTFYTQRIFGNLVSNGFYSQSVAAPREVIARLTVNFGE